MSEWILKSYDTQLSSDIAYECEIPKPIANVLVGRGLNTKEEVIKFCQKNSIDIRSPKNLPDCDKAIKRLAQAIKNNEKIFIWGDYDVDGITATAIVVIGLNQLKANFIYKVPHRKDDGYDIKRQSIDEVLKEKCNLLITVDCGILAFDTANYAKEKKLDLIITDHHSPKDDGTVPDAIAVVNPSRKDSNYGFSGLCGAGVAFKLIASLIKELNGDINEFISNTIEFVALGTVADVAPMEDENRILVHKGCLLLADSKKPGIQELLKITGSTHVDTTTIGFQLGPRINAIGRLSDPMIALELLLETSQQRAKYLALQLDNANKRRQSRQENMLQEAIAIVEEEKLYEMSIIVCWAKSWHTGLIGLVAGKLAEKYNRPSIVLAINEDGNAKGSCRSIKNVNILEILKNKSVIDYYTKKDDGSPIMGGHMFAAGMEIPENNLLNFRKNVCQILAEKNPDYAIHNKIYFVDSRIVAGEINDNTFNALQELAPFGSGHPEPVFWLKNMMVEEQQLLSGNKHIKFILSNENLQYKKISASLWHKANEYPHDYTGKKIDVLFTFGKDLRSFGAKFYLCIIDFKLSN